MNRPRTLAAAVERRDWEAAAVFLLLGFMRAARDIPDATLEDLVAALADTPEDRDERRDR